MSALLTGCCVLNTRPAHQADALSQSIRELGGEAISCPTLAISGLSPEWKDTLAPLDTFHLAIFISANAVHHFFKVFPIEQWPFDLPIIAIGPATAAKLDQYQLPVSDVPTLANSETLLTLPCFSSVKNKSILIIKGRDGRDVLASMLQQQDALVTELPVYERVLPQLSPNYVEQIWRNDRINIILFTSEQGMRQLFALFGEPAHEWLRNKPCLVISQRLCHAALALGIKTVFCTRPDTILQGLVAAHSAKRTTPP